MADGGGEAPAVAAPDRQPEAEPLQPQQPPAEQDGTDAPASSGGTPAPYAPAGPAAEPPAAEAPAGDAAEAPAGEAASPSGEAHPGAAADAAAGSAAESPADDAAAEAPAGPHPDLKVVLPLADILEHCKCSICMGIVKNTRAVSACMHRFCKDCIEAWLRTQIENNCPQCRVKFASKRDCKPDPNFDLLLGAMFGDIADFEKRMLDPTVEVLEQAKAVGHQITAAKQAYMRRPSPPGVVLPQPPAHQQSQAANGAQQQDGAAPASGQQQAADGSVQVTVARGRSHPSKRQLGAAAASEGKRLKLSMLEDTDPADMQYRGVRFQGDNWQARTKRNGKELSLGLYNTAEEAGMAYDLDRLQQQGGKAQRLNFPLLRQHYKTILSDLSDLHTPDGLLDFLAVAVQAAVKSARGVPGATLPENSGPAAVATRCAGAAAVDSGAAAAVQPAAAAAAPPARAVRQAAIAARAASVESEGDDSGLASAEAAEEEEAPEEAMQDALALNPHAAAAQRAEQLAAERPLEAGLAGGVVHLRLAASSGPAWLMSYLACPASATVGQVSEALGVGLAQQLGLAAGSLGVGLTVANDLDASADFDALCYEDAASGALLLRSHVVVWDLLRMLQNPLEDLVLEYQSGQAKAAAPSPGLPGAARSVLAAA